MQNTGFIEKQPLITDFQVGAESGIAPEVLAEDGQYDLYLPDEETQSRNLFDALDCVTFSALNNIETILTYKISKGLIPPEKIQWLKNNGYIDPSTNKVNFSDRFTAKMSGTTRNGNSLGAVGDSIRLHTNGSGDGLVPESAWPWPKEMTDAMTYDEKWNLYYAEIPESVKAIGKKFLEIFDIKYEWVAIGTFITTPAEQIKNALKYGPVQIAAPICPPWGSNEGDTEIKACGDTRPAHATEIYGFIDGEAWKDFDHYKSFRKRLDWNYCIPYAFRYSIVAKVPPVVPAPIVHTFATNLSLGSRGPEVEYLQKALKQLGFFALGYTTQYYGDYTRKAVLAFQLAEKVDTAEELAKLNGEYFGPRSRAIMNALLKK
jgi:hypothetical protein